MTAPSYTDLTTLKNYLGIALTNTSKDATLSLLIPAFSRAIDDYCRRHFWPKTETRIYDWQSGFRLAVDDDLISINNLYNGDGTLLTSDLYILYPLQGPPYRYIDINSSKGAVFFWASTPQACMKVDGVWGCVDKDTGTTPLEIQSACNIWIRYLLTERNTGGEILQRAEDFEVDFADDLTATLIAPPGSVQLLLNPFINREYTSFSRLPSARGV